MSKPTHGRSVSGIISTGRSVSLIAIVRLSFSRFFSRPGLSKRTDPWKLSRFAFLLGQRWEYLGC